MSSGVNPVSTVTRASFIDALVTVLDETKELKDRFDRFSWPLHDNPRIPVVAQFFVQILKHNPSVFCDLDNTAKAQILFDKYRELFLVAFSETTEYKKARAAIETLIVEGTKDPSYVVEIAEKIDEMLKTRMWANNGFCHFAIAAALQVRVGDIGLARPWHQANLATPDETPLRTFRNPASEEQAIELSHSS